MPATARTDPARRGQRSAADPAKTRSFLSTMGHELRTPLNSILGFSEILAAELYGPLGAPQYREYAEIIHASGQKLLKLVDQLMEIARLESGAMAWDLQPLPLEPAIDEALAELARDAERAGVRVKIAGRSALPAVIADPRGLRVMLAGLLHNAITFSSTNGVVRVAALSGPDGVDLIIENDGASVAPGELSRLLQPFEQGGRDEGGAGLGLTICALTCKAMGGRLTLAAGKRGGLRAQVRLQAA